MKKNYNKKRYNNNISLVIVTVASTMILLTGCVGNKKFADVQSQRDKLQSDLAECQQRNSDLQSQVTELNREGEELSRLRNEVNNLERQLEAEKERVMALQNQEPDCPEAMREGVYFKVQIGAFKERNMSDNLDQSVNLDIYKDNGLQEIVVGQFRDYYMADSLQNQLRAMGVKDAWIVPYKDGQRVPLKEVLDTVQE